MAKVEIARPLFEEIKAKFKEESHQVIDLIESLEQNPYKGKPLASIGGILIKELKYKSFRFYFLVEGFKLKCLSEKELVDLLIMFVRMSDKNHQQKTINEIKEILRTIGPIGFE